MPTIEKVLKALETEFTNRQLFTSRQHDLKPENFLDESEYEAQRTKYDREIRDCWERMTQMVQRYDREPQRHFYRHAEKLKQFYQGGKFDENVFIMTKFPSGNDAPAQQLQKVIDTVKSVIIELQYRPQIASQASHQRWLWDNVELFLLGCGRGVAIVEDKYLPELNPNVAMEWGWMVGMGREVLFLREQSFQHDRADWTGLINEPFAWQDPVPGIEAALKKFLPDRTT